MNVFASYSEKELRAYQKVIEHEIIKRKAIPYTQFTPKKGVYYIADSCNCYAKDGLFKTSLEQRLWAKRHYYWYNHNLKITWDYVGLIDGITHYELTVK